MNRILFPVALALVPMLLALLGVAIDERNHLGYSAWFRHHAWGVPSALAAHGGCVFGMAGGLLLCTLTLPLPLMLGAEGLLAALAAGWLFRRIHERNSGASVKPRTAALASAQ